ncbi:MAG: hypothetical protein AB8G86_23600 [Saprospiraceae bacterium]
MDAAALSIYAFGIYEMIAGLGFLCFPNLILSFFKIEKTVEPWIRMVGILAILIGFYHFKIGQLAIIQLYWVTIYARIGFICSIIGLVSTKQAPSQLILFSIASILSTIWTYFTLIY